ncbi:N-acyl homoserine lactonase family protein [Dinghuibacter silviterrae]|uniref:Metallo-beta-lactamase superfamily protein n=1 Tax=Dinghuibacter silviterrae TaxID=1539049 RepID=A0A4R8DMJ2_9BACT|nr:N-acyl homoserine lactonase family protein [Dinghuibacter silviterrae]TDW99209.1 metallo-beta-lactamase superfamily protein [Dinghuibacter silviterrae]
MYAPTTIELTTRGRPLRLHLISTGVVSVKRRYRDARGRGLGALLDFMWDNRFTEWLPIWVMVIEHPDGTFLIDTGEVAAVMDPDYFRSSGALVHWFDRSQFRFDVRREDEIDVQLTNIGIPPSQVKTIVLTHLHFDHTDGLSHFPGTRVLLGDLEWKKPYGALKRLWPQDFHPVAVPLDCPYEMFERTYALTGSEDLLLVHTPGHTWGHASVLIKTDLGPILFAGDVCYSQDQLLTDKYTGANASHRLANDTYERIKAFARHEPLIVLPSHDPEAPKRLLDWEPLYNLPSEGLAERED